MGKNKSWMKFRHRVLTVIIRPFLHLSAKLKYNADVEVFKEQGDRNWLVLANHQTDFDQFFVAASFKKPVYYVAMDDVFSNGFTSRLIEWCVAPIPILKATQDLKAVKTCIRVAREGGTIALFPEGNRTYSGKECYIKPAVASLVQKLGLPIAIYRIEGGYGVKPRWADNIRKGTMTAGVRKIIEPEEYKDLSKEELYDLICKELYVDEFKDAKEYQSTGLAEGLEKVLYVCPSCGISEFESSGDVVRCKHCGKSYRYLPNMHFEALDGKAQFGTVADWYDYQESFIRNYDLTQAIDKPLYHEFADIYNVIVCVNKHLIQKQAQFEIFGDRLEIKLDKELLVLCYEDIKAMACIHDHKLNVFHKDKVYQIQGDKSFNALKYCNIYYHAKYEKEEHTDGEFQFLGL